MKSGSPPGGSRRRHRDRWWPSTGATDWWRSTLRRVWSFSWGPSSAAMSASLPPTHGVPREGRSRRRTTPRGPGKAQSDTPEPLKGGRSSTCVGGAVPSPATRRTPSHVGSGSVAGRTRGEPVRPPPRSGDTGSAVVSVRAARISRGSVLAVLAGAAQTPHLTGEPTGPQRGSVTTPVGTSFVDQTGQVQLRGHGWSHSLRPVLGVIVVIGRSHLRLLQSTDG